MHELDIIVTHYKESNKIVDRFLTSLAEQTYYNFKVTIIDDGLDCPKLLLKNYPFEIEHIKKEHKTVSAARNYGLDHTSAPYLMFCDCDDMFDSRNIYGLEHAIIKIKMDDLYVYRSLISVEAWKKNINNNLSALYKTDDTDELCLFQSSTINSSTVHSKIYKRDFINNFKIRFLDNLWMNEDSVFNSVALDICKVYKYKYFDDCEYFYIWKYNKNSVTRTNKLYPIKGYDQYIIATSYTYRIQKNILNVNQQNMQQNIAQYIFQTYYWLYLYSDRFNKDPEYDICMKNNFNTFKEFLHEFMPKYQKTWFETENLKLYINSFMKKLNDCDISNKVSLEEWLKKFYE